MSYSIQLDLEFGAVSAFVGHLSGNVVELTRSGLDRNEVLCVMIDCEADTDGGFPGVKVRRFDGEVGRAVGAPFVIDLDDVVAISLY